MQFVQPALFPIEAVQTEGFAEPEPRQTESENVADDTLAEAA